MKKLNALLLCAASLLVCLPASATGHSVQAQEPATTLGSCGLALPWCPKY